MWKCVWAKKIEHRCRLTICYFFASNNYPVTIHKGWRKIASIFSHQFNVKCAHIAWKENDDQSIELMKSWIVYFSSLDERFICFYSTHSSDSKNSKKEEKCSPNKRKHKNKKLIEKKHLLELSSFCRSIFWNQMNEFRNVFLSNFPALLDCADNNQLWQLCASLSKAIFPSSNWKY